MKTISFITEESVIRQILEHLNLLEEKSSWDLPEWGLINEESEVVREPFDDGWGNYEEHIPLLYNMIRTERGRYVCVGLKSHRKE